MNNPSKKPKLIYHFTKSDTAIKYIFPTFELRLNNIGNMNDPLENLKYITNNPSKFIFEFSTINKISKLFKILSFSYDKIIDNSTVKGYQFNRMWAHYAGNDEGVCIVINYEKFLEENSYFIDNYKIDNKLVSYNDWTFKFVPREKCTTKPGYWENKIKQSHYKTLINNKNFIKDFIYTKNKDWCGENELRFFTYYEESNILLSFKNSLEYVILGINFSDYFLPSLSQFENLKNKLYKIEINSNGVFEKRPI